MNQDVMGETVGPFSCHQTTSRPDFINWQLMNLSPLLLSFWMEDDVFLW
jgi:hypothetical protein